MKKIRFALFAMLAGLPLAAAEIPQVGQTAPEVSLPSQDGSNVNIKDFRGKWVVLYFYPKDGSTGCTIEAHNFQQDLSKYEAAKAMIVGGYFLERNGTAGRVSRQLDAERPNLRIAQHSRNAVLRTGEPPVRPTLVAIESVNRYVSCHRDPSRAV